MASTGNTLYPTGRTAILAGDIDWDADDFVLYLLSDTYTYDAAHQYGDELTGVLGTPQPLTGCTVVNDGIADADDLTYPDVEIGDTVTRMVILKDTGSLATSPLIYYADTNNDTTPMSRPGNGAGIPIVWSGSANRIFKI